MLLNDNIVDIENLMEYFYLIFLVDDISGLFLHPSIFSIKHSRYTKIQQLVLYQIFDIDYIITFRVLKKHYDVTKIFIFTYFLIRFTFVLFSTAEEWRQFRQQKPPWYLDVIRLNNADSFFTARQWHPSLFRTNKRTNCYLHFELCFET